MELYHFDLKDNLEKGDLIDCSKKLIRQHFDNQEEIDFLFEDQLSSYGQKTFANRSFDNNAGNHVYETIYELYRRSFFPMSISRLQAFYAVETLEDVLQWAKEHQIDKHRKNIKVHKVDTLDSRVQKYDASLLAGGSIEVLENFKGSSACTWAHKYWSGESSSNPKYEYLIQPRIYVLESIDLKLS